LIKDRTRLNRAWAARSVYALFLLALAGIPTTLGAIAVGQFRRLQTEFMAAIDALRRWLFQPIDILGYTLRPQSLLDNLGQLANNALAALPSGSFDVLSGVSTNLLWGVTILVTLYYLLTDGPKIKPWLVGLVPDAYRDEFQRLLDEVNGIWGAFLRAQLLIFVILAVLMGGGTLLVIWLFQTDLLEFSPLALILLLILVYTAAQQVDNLWLHPQLMGNRMRLHPGLVFVGLAGALGLGGALGVIIVVPCMASVKVIGRYVRCKLLGLDPWPPTEAAVAQEEPSEPASTAPSETAPDSQEQDEL
jgi:predicted PurR-regulated permease PerM